MGRSHSVASGLLTCLSPLAHEEPQRTIAIGHAENDNDILRLCGLGVALNNALPMLKPSHASSPHMIVVQVSWSSSIACSVESSAELRCLITATRASLANLY